MRARRSNLEFNDTTPKLPRAKTLAKTRLKVGVSGYNNRSMSLAITNTTKGKLPRLPFAKLTTAVLGKEYECSLVIVSSKKSRKLNKTYRSKDNPTNILSFPLEKNEGEIFLDLETSRKDARLFDRSYTNFIAFLYIHALFHLKGHDHGAIMEEQEKKVRKFFKI